MTFPHPTFSPLFEPTNVADCALWLDASDSASITIATGVSQWSDKSGNSRHVAEATGANQPAVQSGGLNSLSYIQFDGINGRLSNTSWTSQATPVTALGVARVRANSPFAAPLGVLGNAGTGTTAVFDLSAGGATYRLVAGTTLNGSSATNNVWYYFTAQFNGASSFARANGATIISSGNAGSSTSSNFIIGADPTLAVFYPLDVAEVIWYSRAISADEYGLVEQYLKQKWGL